MNLLIFVLAYAAASLLHHAHNAAFVDAYPNMPAWLTAAHTPGMHLTILAEVLTALLLLVVVAHRMVKQCS